MKKMLVTILFVFLISAIPYSSAHIIGGTNREVNGILFQFMTDPAFVIENEDFYLVFSVQNATTKDGLNNIFPEIKIYNENGKLVDIITDIEQIEGDFSLKYRLEQDGLYDIYVEIEEANIGFNLRGVDKGAIRRGDVIGSKDSPAKVVKEMTAQIIVVHHPTAIAPGYTPVIHAHTAQAAATITELVSKLDPRSGGVLEDKPKSLKTGDAAIVKIQPLRPLCLETFKEFPELGRFALRDMGTTIAAGVVKEINAEWEDKPKS